MSLPSLAQARKQLKENGGMILCRENEKTDELMEAKMRKTVEYYNSPNVNVIPKSMPSWPV